MSAADGGSSVWRRRVGGVPGAIWHSISGAGQHIDLTGVPVHPVPVAPRQIPFHAGFVYFELDQANELWAQLKTSGGVALHVAGEFHGIALEFWAIRS